jgi:protein-S-isoprenylcysteine O-methyltransferase Ste14
MEMEEFQDRVPGLRRLAVSVQTGEEGRRWDIVVRLSCRYAQAYKKRGTHMKMKALVGSGDKIGLFTVPVLLIGAILTILFPSFFSVGGPQLVLTVISLIILLPGVTIWIWSVMLIVTNVPQKKLITYGPYALMKHPLYTGVAFLVLPWIGFLLNTWVGVVIGITLYVGSRLFAPEEEALLAKTFGPSWEEYCKQVKIPWV